MLLCKAVQIYLDGEREERDGENREGEGEREGVEIEREMEIESTSEWGREIETESTD